MAALGVVFYHYTSGEYSAPYGFISGITKYGYLGVPLFFMISGFVICASALNRTPAEFAISRVTRLYPTIFICLTFTTLVVLTFGDDQSKVTLIQYITNLSILNVYAGQDYIDDVYWTLLAELKFYICVFLLLFFRLFVRFKIWLTVWMLMTITFLLFDQPFFMGWFISPEYSAFFIAGITFFLINRDGFNNYYLSLIITSLIVGSIRVHQQALGFLYNANHIDQMISMVIIWSFYLLFLMISLDKLRIKNSEYILALGGMTYPIYLLHSRSGSIIYDRLEEIVVNPYILLLFIVSLMLLLSYLVHIYVDKRIANAVKNYLFNKLDENREKSGYGSTDPSNL